jgi:hypothetical protein
MGGNGNAALGHSKGVSLLLFFGKISVAIGWFRWFGAWVGVGWRLIVAI